MKPALIIIAAVGYQDVELAGTKKGLIDAGYDIVIASSVTGMCHGKFGGTETASIALHDVNVDSYDRIAFIGGPGASALVQDIGALNIAKMTVKEGIPLGAICIAPTILAAAGVLKGKRATVWDDGQNTQINFIEQHGAHFTDELVTVDGKIVTGNGPKASEEFGRVLANTENT